MSRDRAILDVHPSVERPTALPDGPADVPEKASDAQIAPSGLTRCETRCAIRNLAERHEHELRYLCYSGSFVVRPR